MSPLRAEMRKLASLALPMMGAQVGTMLIGTVDTLMVARVSTDALAAAAIANAVMDAVGVRIQDLPVTGEKVYRALREREAAARRPS